MPVLPTKVEKHSKFIRIKGVHCLITIFSPLVTSAWGEGGVALMADASHPRVSGILQISPFSIPLSLKASANARVSQGPVKTDDVNWSHHKGMPLGGGREVREYQKAWFRLGPGGSISTTGLSWQPPALPFQKMTRRQALRALVISWPLWKHRPFVCSMGLIYFVIFLWEIQLAGFLFLHDRELGACQTGCHNLIPSPPQLPVNPCVYCRAIKALTISSSENDTSLAAWKKMRQSN